MNKEEFQHIKRQAPNAASDPPWWPFALTNPPRAGTSEAITQDRFPKIIRDQMSQLGGILDQSALENVLESLKSTKQGDPPITEKARRTLDINMLGLGVLQSARSVVRVCGDKDIDSGYVLARTMVERAINYAFLAYSGNEPYHNWLKYSEQKAFRMLSRYQKAGAVEFCFGILR